MYYMDARKGEALLGCIPAPFESENQTDFVDTMTSNILRDLGLSLNQPLKSAHE
jgi:hypothetical protein